MPERRRKFDAEFREGAVRIVQETGKPIAQVARDLGINEGTLGNWVVRTGPAARAPTVCPRDDIEELKRLRAEDAELRMERDVLIGRVEERVRARRGRTSGDVLAHRGSCLRPAHFGVSGPSSMLWWPRVGRGSSPPAG